MKKEIIEISELNKKLTESIMSAYDKSENINDFYNSLINYGYSDYRDRCLVCLGYHKDNRNKNDHNEILGIDLSLVRDEINEDDPFTFIAIKGYSSIDIYIKYEDGVKIHLGNRIFSMGEFLTNTEDLGFSEIDNHLRTILKNGKLIELLLEKAHYLISKKLLKSKNNNIDIDMIITDLESRILKKKK